MRKAASILLPGHPDALCDQIADALVDEYMRRDPNSRVSLVVLGTHGMMMIGGEVESQADFDLALLAREVYATTGFVDDIEIFANIERPTRLSARGVSDQMVIVHGYATAETRERLPRALVHARTLARHVDALRTTDPRFSWMRADGEVAVTCDQGLIRHVAVRVSHMEAIALRDVQTAVFEQVRACLGTEATVSVNATGPFIVDGFRAAGGASGRRTIETTYAGFVPTGAMVFHGQDPWHPARAGVLGARAAARMLVDQGLVQAAQVTVGYEPGRAEPSFIRAIGAGEKARGISVDVTQAVQTAFDFRAEALVERLGLGRPIYRAQAAWGIE